MQSGMNPAEKLRVFGEIVKSGKAYPKFGGNENSRSVEEKFDSG
jgi:hypothetical protein